MSIAVSQVPASTDEAEILALGYALHIAHANKDPEGIAAPYAPHAVIYNLSRRSPTTASPSSASANGSQPGIRRSISPHKTSKSSSAEITPTATATCA